MARADGDARDGAPPGWPAAWAWLPVLVLAFLLRLYQIDTLDVWIDEANAILTAAEPVSVILDKLRLDSSPPLFYFLLHLWIQAFGDGPFALRALSCLTGVALTGATYWAGRELVSRPVGLAAALFVAIAPVQAYYSQQARMYALLPLLALLSVVFLVRFLRDGERRDYVLWIVTTTLALYTHNFAFYLLPIDGVLIALSGQLLRGFRRWALAGAIVGLAYAPWIPFFLEQLGNGDHYAWFIPHWERVGLSGEVQRTFRSYSPGGEYVAFGGMSQYSRWGGWPALATAALAALGSIALARRGRERGCVEAAWPTVFVLTPILCALVASRLLTPHYVAGRVDQMMFPAFALLVAVGLGALRPRPIRVAAWAGIVLVAGWTKLGFYPPPDTHRSVVSRDARIELTLVGTDRDLAAQIAAELRPADVVLCTSLTRASLQYYLGRLGTDARLLSFPRDTASHMGSQNDKRLLGNLPALGREAEAVLAEARAGTVPDGRLFLVRAMSHVNGPLRRDAMVGRYGFELEGELRHYDQRGSKQVVELGIYRPASRP